MNDQRNLILASVLAIAVLLGFNFFYDAPRQQQQMQAKITAQTEQVTEPQAPAQEAEKITVVDRAQALTESKRIKINAPMVHGSINLTGAHLDDVTLAEYHETTDSQSLEIQLLSPKTTQNPYYVDFGWLSKQPDLNLPTKTTVWQTNHTELTPKQPVVLTWNNGQGVTFKRTISIDDQYMFTVTDEVVNSSKNPLSLNAYGQITRGGTPQTGGYFILHEGPIGVINGKLVELDYKKLLDKGQQQQSTTGGWLGITDKYWLVSLIPTQNTSVDTRFKAHTLDGVDYYQTETVYPTVEVAKGETQSVTQHLFAGAKNLKILDEYEEKIGVSKFDLAIDFGWFYFLTKPVFYLLDYLHKIFGNFGIAILVMTVLFKIAFFPLANKSYRSMARMKQMQPKIEQLKKRYGDDKMRMNQELMEIYKREKINPLSGCLPILIQAPVFFCLYKVLFVTLEMRHAPFFGWIHDLSAPDPTSVFNLFGLLPFMPPSFLMIGAWPILMGLTMFLQQKLNPQPTDPAQAKAFMIMPVFLTFLLSSFPAGLVIYWAWSNILSIIQQWAIMRLDTKKDA
ncbi:membrane protein insertase YidC [Candidatus Paracaedibacter symbiosus]|uniref:membrane protein insertase YidC n=1 Tax=Candidatus Paracaedibacter symbiosus TaxID=244582 RepID=UPI000509A34C|nr:membrane protein insertase YidC [Candidatus Paracaedibacter symbiosus]